MKKYEIYLGYDPREDVAYNVLKHSIYSRTDDREVMVAPLSLPNLTTIFNRPIEDRDGQLWCPISDAPMSTEFAISRFCVPFLQDEKWALFLDCDMVCLADIRELFALADDRYAVMCVKHKQESGSDTKMDGQVQSYYKRKNWSSATMWNGQHEANKRLTLNDLNTWPGRDLHAFKWLHDDEIGELPPEWNHLVGVEEGELSKQKLLHYTMGGLWCEGWERKQTDKIWEDEYKLFRKENLVGV